MKQTSILVRLSRKESAPTRVVGLVLRQPGLLPELFRGVGAENPRVKYTSAKVLRLLSEQAPTLVYPQMDFFMRLLDSDNHFLKWDAIRVLANLARVTPPRRLAKLLPRFLAPIPGPVMITAANTIASAARIALTYPALSTRIAQAILKVEQAVYQTPECRNVAIGHAIKSLDRFFHQIPTKKVVLQFVRRQLDNARPATRKRAEAFLQRHAPRRGERPLPARTGKAARTACCLAALCLAVGSSVKGLRVDAADEPPASASDTYRFDKTISRRVLENYLSRAITMEGLLNGRGDLADNIRMLQRIGAKYIGRSLCLWGGEANLLRNLERAKQQLPQVRAADPDMILQACIFEIVTTQVEQVPVPDWAFAALGQPAQKRNFHYVDMLYPNGRLKDHWGPGQSVPDVSRSEAQLWFYFLAVSFVDAGCEAIHFGQTELMNGNDPGLDHYARVLTLIRSYAAQHARRHMVLCDSHVPSGGLVRQGQLLMDFHSFPLRIMELPDRPQEAILKVGFSDGIYGRSKGGTTFSGWQCEHLPYLVEIDNWGVSRQPGQARAGGIWIWGYDEISWFAHQSQEYRARWLRYAWDWVRQTDPNGHLQMPGSRTLAGAVGGKRWYYANNPSSLVPDGLGDEEVIRAIWVADRTK